MGLAAQPGLDNSRGALLYTTHCIACHDASMHWRDNKAVKDWSSLHMQVQRWQSAANLDWTPQDVSDVARYLDALYYKLPGPR